MMFRKSDREAIERARVTAANAEVFANTARNNTMTLLTDTAHIIELLRRARFGDGDPAMFVSGGGGSGGAAPAPKPPELRDIFEPYHREVVEQMKTSRCSMAAAYKTLRISRLKSAIGESSRLSHEEKAIWLQSLALLHGEE